MGSVASRPSYTFREYLRLEADSNVRHEYLDGQIYAMAGGTPEHAAISVNVSTALSVQLRGSGCRVYSSDLRVRVGATGLATYPDVSVVCGGLEVDPDDANTVTNPILVVEVLSPSSAAYDRGEKFAHYQQVPSLLEVVFVWHDRERIEVWRRVDGGVWAAAPESSIARLECLDCELAVEDAYRDEL